jgi:hypothetical protein
MSIYSAEVQQLTDQLVADVTNLHGVVAANSSDFSAIDGATTPVETTATSLDQAIKSADIPPDNTQILSLTTQIFSQIDDLQASITANDSALVETRTDDIVLTTSNINRCVTSMAENAVPPPPEVLVPPWLQIPCMPIPD